MVVVEAAETSSEICVGHSSGEATLERLWVQGFWFQRWWFEDNGLLLEVGLGCRVVLQWLRVRGLRVVGGGVLGVGCQRRIPSVLVFPRMEERVQGPKRRAVVLLCRRCL